MLVRRTPLGFVSPTELVGRPRLSEPLFASASQLSAFERRSCRRLPETSRRSTYHFASLAPSGYVRDVTEISPSTMSLRYWPEMRW
jgi:hypothetical protein